MATLTCLFSFFLLGMKAVARNSNEKIPLLESVFKAFPEHPINVDIKDNNDELIDKVYQLIVDYNRKDLTVWGNFSDEVNSKLHKKVKQVPTSLNKKLHKL